PANTGLVRQIRQRDQPVAMQAADHAQLIIILIGGFESIDDERISDRIFDVRELGKLTCDARIVNGRLRGNEIAESNAVIEGACLDRKLASARILKVGLNTVVVVANRAGFAHRYRIALIDRSGFGSGEVHAWTKRRLAFEIEAELRRCKE